MNPIAYAAMKPSSILKKFKEPAFAAKIDRRTIELGAQHLGIPLDVHIANVGTFLGPLN
jgi:predicted hydrolase (HD superfamily)